MECVEDDLSVRACQLTVSPHAMLWLPVLWRVPACPDLTIRLPTDATGSTAICVTWGARGVLGS
jgi:hypothetical protein